jgi:cell wall-associated NlpC family hydrolase
VKSRLNTAAGHYTFRPNPTAHLAGVQEGISLHTVHSPRCALPASQTARSTTRPRPAAGPKHRATNTRPRHRVPSRGPLRTTALAGVVVGSIGVGLAGFAVVPASAATPATAKVAGASTINAGASTTLSAIGTVNGKPAAYKTFSLQYYASSGWKTVNTKKARPSGQLEWTVRPGGSSNWRVVLYIDGSQRKISLTHHITVKVSGSAVVAMAAKNVGKPYVYGAAGPNSFDCSGFTEYVYKKFGKSLPHSATGQAKYGSAVSKTAKKPGDLILFGSGGYYSHAAIYAGGNTMWDAATTGTPVGKHTIWSNTYIVRRLV